MKKKKEEYDFLKHGISQSMLQAWLSCKKKVHLSLEGWQHELPKESLIFGSLYHDILEHHYNSIIQNKKPLENIDEFLSEWKTEILKKETIDAQRLEFFQAMAKQLFSEYIKFWKEDLKRNWIGLETKFDVKFNDIRLRGMRDGVFRNKKKELWLLETKTKSQFSEDELTKALDFDFQNLYYITATEAETGEEVQGVLYNIIRKPQSKAREIPVRDNDGFKIVLDKKSKERIYLKTGKPRQQGGDNFFLKTRPETPKEFGERISKDIEDRPEFYFVRYQITYSKRQKQLFKEELTKMLGDFEEWFYSKDRASRSYRGNSQACYGRFACEFLQMCGSGSSVGYSRNRKHMSELGGI